MNKLIPLVAVIAAMLISLDGCAHQDSLSNQQKLSLAQKAKSVGFGGSADAVQQHPNDIKARMELGNSYLIRNQPAAAVTQFRAVVKLQPDNRHAKYMLATALQQAGSKDEARQLYVNLAAVQDKIGKAAVLQLQEK